MPGSFEACRSLKPAWALSFTPTLAGISRARAAFHAALVRILVVDIKAAREHLAALRVLLSQPSQGAEGGSGRRGEAAGSSASLRHLGPAREGMYEMAAGTDATFDGGRSGNVLGRSMTVVLLNKLDTRTCSKPPLDP